MNQSNLKQRTPYEKKLFWRKARMYLAWALTFIACLIVSLYSFDRRFFGTINPQVRGAYTQIARLMPTLEANEKSLVETYELLLESREEAKAMGITLSQDTIADTRSAQDIIEGSFSMSRITHLAVGHNGIVFVARKDTGEIVAHPNESLIGKTLMVSSIRNRDLVSTEGRALATSVVNYRGIPDLELSSFTDGEEAQKINLRHLILFSGDGGKFRLTSALGDMVFGSIVPYGPFYIVCGISIWEYLSCISRAVFISLIACVILWLFVHYISLTLDRREMNGRDLLRQLTAYGLVITLVIFGVSWYVQVLNNVTNDLNAMQSYADSGVDTLQAYQDIQKEVDGWFDEQYLTQCRIARDYAKTRGAENITRKDLAELSETLGVQHIYIFDREGRVIVTNSPYDHLKLSDDSSDASHAFMPLLEGADHVVQPPMPDEISGSRSQFIGVSLRNEADMADGFVQISVDPALRDYLTRPLGVNSVLTDMTVGLPTSAIALDKKDLTISATTGLGYIGESIEDYGYNADKLKDTRSGFLRHGEKIYYAGFGESEAYYLIPVAERVSDTAAILISLCVALVVLVGQALILLMALLHYQRDVVDAAPPREAITEEPTQDAALQTKPGKREKKGFDRRWHVNSAKSDLTPAERVKAIAYKLLLVFCVLSLLPLAYGKLSNGNVRLSGLSYVLYGNWEKGVNIFAVTSCLVLLLALYIFVTVSNRVLYSIARVSDMRTETICLLLRSSLKYVCVIAFIYYGLSRFGIPTQALLASAGIITLAVSMGAKDMVNDIIAGFFILLEGNFKVGDSVTVGGWSGTVQEIGLRTTRIKMRQDIKIFNNSSIRDIINTDSSEQDDARVTLKLPVGLNANLGEIEGILEAELPELMTDVPGMVSGPRYEGVDSIKDGCMILRITFDVKYDRESSANRELNRRMKLLFERHGIEIPVNPVYVYQANGTPEKAD